MDADHTALLYQTQVCWLSKGNMLSRIFELREEVKLFLVAKQKTQYFVGIWWRWIFYILSLPC